MINNVSSTPSFKGQIIGMRDGQKILDKFTTPVQDEIYKAAARRAAKADTLNNLLTTGVSNKLKQFLQLITGEEVTFATKQQSLSIFDGTKNGCRNAIGFGDYNPNAQGATHYSYFLDVFKKNIK